MAKITKRTVDTLIGARSLGVIRGDDLKGFGARLKHGPFTPDQARNLAKKMLARVLAGDDPAAERANRRREMTVGDLLRQTLATHWRVKSKPTTIKNFASTIDHSLMPEFGTRRLSELTRSQIRAWHAKQTHRRRQANLDLAILRKALNLAVSDELIKENPASGIQLHPERRRDRIPTDQELAAVLKALDTTAIRPQVALLFKLLLFTGCRTSEWRAAEWAWIDADTGTLRLPDAKAGARPVALSRAAQALLSTAPRRSRYIIPSDSGEAPMSSSTVSHAWEAIRIDAGVLDLRVHDLRHAFATRGAGLGASAVILRDALGHKTLSMTSRYVSRQDNLVRELVERIGVQIQELVPERGYFLGTAERGNQRAVIKRRSVAKGPETMIVGPK
jgi:integrase